MEVAFPTLQAGPNAETGQSSSLRSKSVAEGANDQLRLPNSGQNYRRAWSALPGLRIPTFSSNRSSVLTPHSSSIAERSSVDWDESRSFHDMANVSALSKEDPHQFSLPPSVSEGRTSEEFYDQLEQSMAEAENSGQEAFEEDASDAIHKAQALERLYAEEVRQRKEVEEALKRMKQQVGQVAEELHIAVEHKSSPESQIANFSQMVKDLEQKWSSAVELLHKYKKERDEFQAERDNALKEAEELRKEQAEASASTLAPEFFYEFSLSEIKKATSSFDPSCKIGEGGYGNIYKCLLRHTEVAIKMLCPNSKQGPSEFQNEVTVLSKLRHPNIVTLIGACPELRILVYEYLPNGSLEDRLCCKDNTPPLSWQTRIRIAAELCSALIFLHSSNPNRIVHGDVKPSNILLDSNFVGKLSDFGICRVLNQNEFSSNNTTLCCITDHPRGTLVYMDPEFMSTGEMTTKSDVYSFGIILLRLLTGRPAKGIAKEVKCALDKGNLKNFLDPTAGDWPSVQAQQLAHIALRCCEMNRCSRPDLASDVWRVLERMRVSCGAPPFLMNSEEDCRIPMDFISPTINRSGSTTSHSQNERTRDQPEGHKRKIKNLTIEDLQPYVGLTRANAAKKFQMSETTFKRQCRRLKIGQWPKLPPGEEILKPPDPNTGQIEMVNELGHLPEPIEVRKPPDPHERTTRETEMENEVVGDFHEPNELLQDCCDGLVEWNIENDSAEILETATTWHSMEFIQSATEETEEAFQVTDDSTLSTAYPHPNPVAVMQPQVASTHIVSGNMEIPNDQSNSTIPPTMVGSEYWSDLSAFFKEPFQEGHVSGYIDFTVPSCPDPAPSHSISAIARTMPEIPFIETEDTGPVELKATYGDKTIKFQLPPMFGISELKEKVSKILECELRSFDVEYKDGDGEWILMGCDENVREYMQLLNSLGKQVTKLKISDKVPNSTNFCETCG